MQTPPEGVSVLTRDQQYAAKIYEQMGKVTKEYHQVYGGMAQKLPILIRTAGLAQALAFVASRAESDKKANTRQQALACLLNDLAAVVGSTNQATLLDASRGGNQLTDLGAYMDLTNRVLAALLWYKRFAESEWNITLAAAQDVGETQ